MAQLEHLAYSPDGADHISDNRLFGMFHSGTPDHNKEVILKSIQESRGVCRVLFATSAIGMRVDVQGLHLVIHWGPPSKLEHYMQEIGRADRDGIRSTAICV